VLVSGDALTPVQSTYSQPAITAAAKPKAAAAQTRPTSAAVAVRADGSAVMLGDPLAASPMETLPPGHLTVAGSPPPPQHPLPRLNDVLRVLQITR
jgi:hypothetical protein